MVQQADPIVLEVPTFAQSLVIAVAAFSAQLGALSTARGGVTTAAEGKASAQTQLTSAQEVEKEAVASEAQVKDLALAARDEVVVILQGWTP